MTMRASSFFSLFFLKKKVYWRGEREEKEGGSLSLYSPLLPTLVPSAAVFFFSSLLVLLRLLLILHSVYTPHPFVVDGPSNQPPSFFFSLHDNRQCTGQAEEDTLV